MSIKSSRLIDSQYNTGRKNSTIIILCVQAEEILLNNMNSHVISKVLPIEFWDMFVSGSINDSYLSPSPTHMKVTIICIDSWSSSGSSLTLLHTTDYSAPNLLTNSYILHVHDIQTSQDLVQKSTFVGLMWIHYLYQKYSNFQIIYSSMANIIHDSRGCDFPGHRLVFDYDVCTK